MIQVTLNFPSAVEAAEALQRLAAVSTRAAEIAPDDRPDVGLAVPLPPFNADAPVEFNPFAAPQHTPEPAAAPAGPTPPTVDSTGLPWDGRIHGSTKSLNADGTWRQKRGLNDPALKARVEAELRAAASAGSSPAGVAAPVAPPPAPLVATPPAPPTVASTAPAVPPAPVSGPVTPLAAAGPETFGQLMARLAPQFAAQGAVATDRMTQALNAAGLQVVAQLASRPDLIPSVAATYDALTAAAA